MENNIHRSSLWSSGLIGISILILQSFLSLNALDVAAYVSVFAFALALPILACNILVNFARRGTRVRASMREILFYIAGMIATIVGVAAAFWHICRFAAVIFSVSTLIALFVYFKLTQHRFPYSMFT